MLYNLKVMLNEKVDKFEELNPSAIIRLFETTGLVENGKMDELHETAEYGTTGSSAIAAASTLICEQVVVKDVTDSPTEIFYVEGREGLAGSSTSMDSPHIIVRREGEEDEIIEIPPEPESIDDLREVIETLWMSPAERLHALELGLGRRVDAREIKDPLMASIFTTNNPKDAFGLIASYKMLIEPFES